MAAEVVKLRDKIEELELGMSTKLEAESAGLSSYDPNNPYVLQRKIGKCWLGREFLNFI